MQSIFFKAYVIHVIHVIHVMFDVTLSICPCDSCDSCDSCDFTLNIGQCDDVIYVMLFLYIFLQGHVIHVIYVIHVMFIFYQNMGSYDHYLLLNLM